MITKKCSCCKIEKDVSEFSLNSYSKDKLRFSCKECEAIITKERRLKKIELRVGGKYKKCNACSIHKPITDFTKSKNSVDGLTRRCVNCVCSGNFFIGDESDVLICSNCNEYKHTSSFHKDASSKNGYYCLCINCHNSLNKDAKREYDVRYRNNNRQLIKERRANNPIYVFSKAIRKKIENIFLKANFSKTSSTAEILQLSFEEFKIYIENMFSEEMSWENRGTYWHIDHVIPISFADTAEEITILNHYTNLRPLEAKENLAKNNKVIESLIQNHFKQFDSSPAYELYLLKTSS